VDAGPFEPLALVEAVSVCALPTRVEVKLADASGTTKLGKPREKRGSVPARTSLGKPDEIIDVQVAAPRETFAEAKPGYGYWIATVAQRRKLVARALLRADTGKEGWGVLEIAEMSDHREAGENLLVGFGEIDRHDDLHATISPLAYAASRSDPPA
jgi:hypothetical protein